MKIDFLVLAKGMLMGAADIVPGVSGGTIAFITGIYDRLLAAISGFLPAFFRLLKHRTWKTFLLESDLIFVATLFSGILLSIAVASKFILFLLSDHPIPIWSFFFGLIVASTFLVGGELHFKRFQVWGFLVVGALVAVSIIRGVPGEMTPSAFNAFLAGSIAICAMILPGISGSFILVLLGAYSFVLGAISQFNFPVLVAFLAGCIFGLLLFSRVLVFALSKYREAIVALLLGFMIGSLEKVWPWKQTMSFRENRHGEMVPLVEKNVLPTDYQVLTGIDPQVLAAVICFIGAILAVWGTHFLAKRMDSKTDEVVT